MRKIAFLSLMLSIICIISCSCGKKDEPVENVSQAPVRETVRVTLKEGITVLRYGEALEQAGVCSASDFYDAVNNIDYTADYDFLPSSDILEDRVYKLEGYLFPDTYEFYKDESAETVVRKLLSNFDKRFSEELREKIGYNGLTLDETIILASIVERETPVHSEIEKISAVFLNRLNNPAEYPRLQSDATKFYPYDVSYENIPENFVSEYNTYNVKGLPKGPICNPSLAAVAGSLAPDLTTDAYFFFTDNNNKHYYAKTYAEHKKNIKYCEDNGLY